MTTMTDLDADLDAHIVGDEMAWDEDVEPRTLATVDEADRALRRIRRIDHDLARAEKLAAARVEQVKEWLHDRSDVLLRERDWWSAAAENWMRAYYAETGKQTEKLPSGTLSLRKAKVKVEQTIQEPPEDIADGLVRTKREWDKRAVAEACEPGPEIDDAEDLPEGYALHAVVDANGEVVNGVTFLVPTRHSFSLKAGEAS